MSANFKALRQELFTSTASGIVPPVLGPQGCDEVEQLLAKIAYSLANGGSVTTSSASGLYTAVAPYYATSSGAGTTPASLSNFSVTNGGTGIASFNGVALPGGMTIRFDAAPGTKFLPTSFNGSGNSLYIAGSQFV
jgi:hypothetical protein